MSSTVPPPVFMLRQRQALRLQDEVPYLYSIAFQINCLYGLNQTKSVGQTCSDQRLYKYTDKIFHRSIALFDPHCLDTLLNDLISGIVTWRKQLLLEACKTYKSSSEN